MNEPVTKRDLIEANFQKVFPAGSEIAISETTGGLAFRTMQEVIEGSKMMSMAGSAVPAYLQGNPGGCWAIIVQASQWNLDPISVARLSYEVNGVVAYVATMYMALINTRAPLIRRLRYEYSGEGQELQCKVIGWLRGEVDPLEYDSPPIRLITPKKSPLWQTDPKQQLAYYSARAFAKRYCSEVLAGCYDHDDAYARSVEQRDERNAKAAEGLHERLAAVAAVNQDRAAPVEGFGQVDVDVPPESYGAVSDGGYIEGAPAEPASEPKTRKGRKGSPKAGKRASEPATVTEDAPAEKEPERKAEPKVQTKADDPAPAPAKLPTNPQEYAMWVERWVQRYQTEEKLEGHWRSEMRLRNNCGVTAEDRALIRAIVDARVLQVRQ